jgi:hypothetical protein
LKTNGKIQSFGSFTDETKSLGIILHLFVSLCFVAFCLLFFYFLLIFYFHYYFSSASSSAAAASANSDDSKSHGKGRFIIYVEDR